MLSNNCNTIFPINNCEEDVNKMALTCRDLINHSVFEKIHLIAGQEGLNKEVTWLYVKQTDSLKGWLNGGEMVFVVEKTFDKGEQYFRDIINECVEMRVAALVFLCGGDGYISNVSEDMIDLANDNCLPVFEMPSTVRIVDITRVLSNTIFQWSYKNGQTENFLLDLIHSDYMTGINKQQDGMFYGFDLTKSYIIAVICDKNFIEDTHDLDRFALSNKYSVLKIKLKALFERVNEQCFCIESCGTMVMYISCQDKEKRKGMMKKMCGQLRDYNFISNSAMMCGCSEMHHEIEAVPHAYDEARKTLRYTMKNGFGRICCAFEDMGILRFLIADKDKEEVLEYCENLLADIREIDKKNSSTYVETLWTYLKMNNNLVQTASKLYMHRNTLLNRINKIQMVTGKDVNDPYVKQEYMNAFLILEFYGKL